MQRSYDVLGKRVTIVYNNTEFIAMKLLSKADLRRMVHEIYIEIKIDI